MFYFHQDYLKMGFKIQAGPVLVLSGAPGVCEVPGDALIVIDAVWNINLNWSD